MAFSLRLPSILDRQARAKADQLGLPLNGLICVALDAFLNGRSALVPSVPVPVDDLKPVLGSHGGMPLRTAAPSPVQSLASAPARVGPVDPLLSRENRRKLARQGRHQRNK